MLIDNNRTMFDYRFSSVDFKAMNDHYSKFETVKAE